MELKALWELRPRPAREHDPVPPKSVSKSVFCTVIYQANLHKSPLTCEQFCFIKSLLFTKWCQISQVSVNPGLHCTISTDLFWVDLLLTVPSWYVHAETLKMMNFFKTTHRNTYPGKTSCHTKEYLSWFWGESSNSEVFMVKEKHSNCAIYMKFTFYTQNKEFHVESLSISE